MDEGITYQKLHRWKYRLVAPYEVEIPLTGRIAVSEGEYVVLDGGLLCLKKGYAWDGPSGPGVRDTKNFMRASLVHDALYQLMSEGLLDQEYRGLVDRILYDHCLEDGMSRVRARTMYWGLRVFGAKFAKPSLPLPVFRAP